MKLSFVRPASAALCMLVSFNCLAADISESSIKMIEPTEFGIDQAEIEEIRSQMQAAVDEDYIAGALIMVGNDDGVGMLESVGTQGPEDDMPVDEETIFRIYSMTKPIASVAAMSLVEDGLLNVDDPVGKYIPAFNEMEIIDNETGKTRKAENTMTVAHLLSHKTGLIQAIFSPDTDLGRMYQEQIASGDMTAREMADRLGNLPLYFEPGTAWHYGRSTDVLGAVLEIAADKPLDEILQERIFDPLGMDDTSFFVPEDKASRIAQPVHGDMADNTVVRKFLSAGGGLNSTAEDYARFANMLLNDGEYRGTRILEKETLDRMKEPQIDEDVSREYFFYGPYGNWSLGFHLQPVDGNNDGPFNFGWRGIGGTLFLVDQENDFYMVYMEQKRGGPRGAPFDNSTAQRVIYEAMED